ncbi:MAG TPA: thioredoxin family protein [Bacteroidia bacterium]|nr:thioredoxin family protein [Bacteroidia bacterium]
MTKQALHSLSYTDYMKLVEDYAAAGKTSGLDQTDHHKETTKLNVHRMQRLNKTAEILPELREAMGKLKNTYSWLVLAETWCGDAAQCVPIIHLTAALSQKIEIKILLRDENLDLMDRYLTNGARAIPKLICIEKSSGKELFHWGPRPKPAQDLAIALKAQNASKDEKGLAIQKWYNADKGLHLQQELLALVRAHLS